MGATSIPSSLLAQRGATAASRAGCASCRRLRPASIGSSIASAAASSKEPKRPGPYSNDDPPTKRRRTAAEDAAVAAARAAMPAAVKEKDGFTGRRVDPAGRVGSSTATAAISKEPKPGRPGSYSYDEPPTKRRLAAAEDAGAARARAMSSSAEKEKDAVTRLRRQPVSRLPLVRSQHEVISLPDSAASVLQEIGSRTRRCGGITNDEDQIKNNTTRAIKDRGDLGGKPLREDEDPLQSEERVMGQSAPPRSILFPSRSVPKSITPVTPVPTRTPSKAASSKSTLPRAMLPSSILQKPRTALPKNIPPKPVPKSNPSTGATSKGMPPRATSTTCIPPRYAPASTTLKPASKFASKIRAPVKASPLVLVQPNQSQSRESVKRKLAEMSISLQSTPTTSAPPTPAAPPPPLVSPKKSLKELISEAKVVKENARRRELEGGGGTTSTPSTAAAAPSPKKSLKEELSADASEETAEEIARRQELEILRAAARWEMEQIVRTVEFNDPYIDPTDAFQ